MQALTDLFVSDFMPHGHCYFWRPDILWTHVISDGVIALAYFCIPAILLYYLVKKRPQRIPFWWVIILFAGFIYLCGMTHVIGIVTVWTPIYVVEGWLKAVTAVISIVTAASLIPLVPRALTLKSAEELAEVNSALSEEIHVRDQVQRELSSTVTALKQSNQELEDITSITAHDLQAPLRRMITFADALKAKLSSTEKLDPEIHKLVSSIEQNGLRMRQHLEAVLDFSTLETRSHGQLESDIKTLLKRVVAEFRKDHTLREFDIEIDDMPVIQAPQQVMYHVFYNLLDNAIKYQSPDRPLVVKVSAEKIVDNANHSFWQFGFSDNGVGFNPDQSNKIFKLFGRLHNAKNYTGSGVGLATIKKMLAAYGGNIWVDAVEGQGCQFHFTLPISPARDASS